MRTYPDCIPCILRASLTAGRLSGKGEEELWSALQEAARVCAAWERERPPIALGAEVAAVLKRKLGQGDPFWEAKKEGNAAVLRLYSALKERVRSSEDPLFEALRLSAAGNALDLGVHPEVHAEEALSLALRQPLGRWDYELFQKYLKDAESVLYLADNAGEIVVDRILIEELLTFGKKVTLAVRGGPILNDVTLADLAGVGIPKEVEIISTGSDLPGVFLPLSSPEFLARFHGAELILSKGMGNFEGLHGQPGPIFFLFQAKCYPVAKEAGVKVGSLVLLGPRDEGRKS